MSLHVFHHCVCINSSTSSQTNYEDINERGQLAIEFAIMFPVLLLIAVIGFNTLSFFGYCASFDRTFRQAVITQGSSPNSLGETALADIINDLEIHFSEPYVTLNIDKLEKGNGLVKFMGTITYEPTLFGARPINSLFGVSIAPLTHQSNITIELYKPGNWL